MKKLGTTVLLGVLTFGCLSTLPLLEPSAFAQKKDDNKPKKKDPPGPPVQKEKRDRTPPPPKKKQ